MRMYKPNLSFCDPLPVLPVATIESNSAKTSNVRATSALPALLGRYPAVDGAAGGGTDGVRVVPSASPAVLVQDRAPVAAQRADDMSINVKRLLWD